MLDGLYFFMFSNGEYSDYCVGGLYVCDHIVSKKEWDDFVEHKSIIKSQAREQSILAYCARTGVKPVIYGDGRVDSADGWWSSPEREGYRKFADENNACALFINLHNMKPVEYQELWEY